MNIVNALTGFVSGVNKATLSGALDVIAVKHDDGTYACTPFHVRFGKLQVFRSREKVVNIYVNGHLVDVEMKLGDAGEGYFLTPVRGVGGDDNKSVTDLLVTPARPGKTAALDAASTTTPANTAAAADTKVEDGDEVHTQAADSEEEDDFAVGIDVGGPASPRPEDASKADDPAADAEPDWTWGWGRLPQRVQSENDLSAVEHRMKGTRSKHKPSYAAVTRRSKQQSNSKDLPPLSLPPPAGPATAQAKSLIPPIKGATAVGWFDPKKKKADAATADAVPSHPLPVDASADEYDASAQSYQRVWSSPVVGPRPVVAQGADGEVAVDMHEAPPAPLLSPPPPRHEGVAVRHQRRRSLSQDFTSKAQAPSASVSLSLCGDNLDAFDLHRVSMAAFHASTSAIVADANLRVRIIGHCPALGSTSPHHSSAAGEPVYYLTWPAAAPAVLSVACFGAAAVASAPSEGERDGESEGERERERELEMEVAKSPSRRGWFSWLRGNSADNQAETSPTEKQSDAGSVTSAGAGSAGGSAGGNAAATSPSITGTGTGTGAGAGAGPGAGAGAGGDAESEDRRSAVLLSPSGTQASSLEDGYDSDATFDRATFRRTLRPTSEQLASLGLNPGVNQLTFEVTSGGLQGTVTVSSSIFLWNEHSKIVVSDVDGTITKSDVMGHVSYMFGRDWTHAGVARFFSNIKANGYQIVYLTSRAIGQTSATKAYLENISQEDAQLPPGPVITSPDRLFTAFKREVIDRQPQLFKKAALRDIQMLFPAEATPFYAGFGNRDTDVVAYKHVLIPDGKIFIINPSGEVKQMRGNRTYLKSYPSLNELVDTMFPAIMERPAEHGREGRRYGAPTAMDEAFNDANFWGRSIGVVIDEEEEEKQKQKDSKKAEAAEKQKQKQKNKAEAENDSKTSRDATK